jgi:hypothetical protein
LAAAKRTLFASVNLIGDTITQTPALRRYRAAHPEEEIVWLLKDGPDRCLFELLAGSSVCDRVLFDADWDRVRAADYPGYDNRFLMDVSRAFTIGSQESIHIAQAFGRLISAEVPAEDVLATVPVSEKDLKNLGIPPRCLVISPRSNSNHAVDGFAGSKNLPWRAWPLIIDRFLAAKRVDNYVVLLADNDPAPEVPICVLRLPLSATAAYISKACTEGGAYCGVDNGITHIAAGLGVPTFCVYPDVLSEGWVGYSRFPHYRIARTTPWKADVDQIWNCWKHRL